MIKRNVNMGRITPAFLCFPCFLTKTKESDPSVKIKEIAQVCLNLQLTVTQEIMTSTTMTYTISSRCSQGWVQR